MNEVGVFGVLLPSASSSSSDESSSSSSSISQYGFRMAKGLGEDRLVWRMRGNGR
jgi:hypothetical protein